LTARLSFTGRLRGFTFPVLANRVHHIKYIVVRGCGTPDESLDSWSEVSVKQGGQVLGRDLAEDALLLSLLLDDDLDLESPGLFSLEDLEDLESPGLFSLEDLEDLESPGLFSLEDLEDLESPGLFSPEDLDARLDEVLQLLLLTATVEEDGDILEEELFDVDCLCSELGLM
jgi:hypothetical protein